MTTNKGTTLYFIATGLMAAPGVFPTEMRLLALALMGVGCLLLIAATIWHGFAKPETALLLLIFSNLSYWLSHALWILRPSLVGAARPSGIDPFAGPQSIWLLIFPIFAIYESAVFLPSIFLNRERRLAVLGSVCVLAQVFTTVRTIYRMIQGV